MICFPAGKCICSCLPFSIPPLLCYFLDDKLFYLKRKQNFIFPFTLWAGLLYKQSRTELIQILENCFQTTVLLYDSCVISGKSLNLSESLCTHLYQEREPAWRFYDLKFQVSRVWGHEFYYTLHTDITLIQILSGERECPRVCRTRDTSAGPWLRDLGELETRILSQ